MNRISNVIALRERNLQVSEIAARMECSERTVRRLLEQGARSEQRIVEFEAEWRNREVPRIEDALPSQGNPTRGEILEELVKVDMEYRWRHPELCQQAVGRTGLPPKARVEDYLQRFPELIIAGQLPASLITEEFRVRMKWGDKPDYSEYQRRFPNRKNSLAQQLDRVHDDLAAEQSLDLDEQPSLAMTSAPTDAARKPESRATSENPSASSSQSKSSSDARFTPTLDEQPLRATTDTHRGSRSDKYTTRAEPKKGGMAIVWRAFDSRLNREVAYKELRPDRANDREFLAMFLHEAQVTGQLEHPNIVPVYELGGDEDERPFYTMKYVRGGTLTELIEEYQAHCKAGQVDRLELHRMLNVFLDVCHAVRYAHSRGVLHRDLKPDNVMVGDYGEVLVVDWGLAKVLGVSDADLPAVQLSRSDQLFTEVGARKGTPAYWAPEQAEGRTDLVDGRTDIYGLGGILYQMLTGSVPHPDFDGDDSKVSHFEVSDPREIVPTTPAPLAAICMKALAPQRRDRYEKVDELIRDVECWRVDEPVQAYDETLTERTVRHIRRNWVASAITLVGAAAIILVLTVLQVVNRNNRNELMNREIESLSAFANSQEAKLMARIDVLRQDVSFLSTIDSCDRILRGEATPDEKRNIEEVFIHFLAQRPEYMQLRLIRKDGKEVVRVQRNTPEGKVIVIPDEELQNKGGRDYFEETMKVNPGGWYLSNIELNQENNKKDKNLPVIRGAVPVFGRETIASDDSGVQSDHVVQTHDGIVIINLHFRKLVSDLRDFEERSASGLVYLTDANGRFLYHPQKDIAFAFERGLEYRMQKLYACLNDAYKSRLKQAVQFDAKPQIALFVKPDPNYVRDDPLLWKSLNDSMATALITIGTDHPDVKYERGNEGDAVLLGVSKSELETIRDELAAVLPVKIDARILGAKLANESQAVHYNRLSLEPGNEARSLGLALVVPYNSLATPSSSTRLIFWSTLAILAIGILSLVYFVARRTPRPTLSIEA